MGGAVMTSATARPQPQVRLPQCIVDLAADELRTAKGEHVELRPRSFAVLRLLAEHAGRLVTKDELITKVWDDVAVTEDSLTQCIADIRKAIGDEDRRVLRTVPRKGYLLVPSQRDAPLAGRVPDRPSLAVMPFMAMAAKLLWALASLPRSSTSSRATRTCACLRGIRLLPWPTRI
jgi:DNA-binding winged helix-turn-helix (wHTH) protein